MNPPHARLFSKVGPFAGRSFAVGEEVTFGRSPDNAVVLADPAVSGRHGRIFWDPEEGCYRIEDLGSRNGTWVAGIRVREPEPLGPLDVIGVAGVGDLVFQVVGGERAFETDLDLAAGDLVPPDLDGAGGAAEAAGAAGRTFADAEPLAVPGGIEGGAGTGDREALGRTIYEDFREGGEWVVPDLDGEASAGGGGEPLSVESREAAPSDTGRTVHDAEPLALPELPADEASEVQPAAPAAPPAEAFFLEVETAEAGTVRHLLAPGEHLVGRGSDADVVVESPTLSRAHARLLVSEDGVRLIDLESTNGTRVAGAEAAPGAEVALAPGTELELGSVPCRLVRAPVDTPEEGGS